ncbi:MAG: hypothetical protein LBT29_01170 [Flavobacteriaceae bacterium]|nr:hypothetical protein [Flavobacteriaceae bacterium]
MRKSHALIEKRRQAGLQAVEEMSKQHLSLDQWLELIRGDKAARTKH